MLWDGTHHLDNMERLALTENADRDNNGWTVVAVHYRGLLSRDSRAKHES